MALTGYDEHESGSSDDGNVEMNANTGQCADDDGNSNTTGNELNAANLEEHNKYMGSSAEGNEEQVKVPSQVGAGLLFGLSGLFLGGPIIALLTGVGATYVASNDQGPVGDAARASGEFAVETGTMVGEAAKEVNEKHGILEKIQNAFSSGWGKVKEVNEEHRATERVKETMSGVTQKTVEFEKKHHVVENILEGIQSGVNFLLDKLRNTTEECNGNGSGTSST